MTKSIVLAAVLVIGSMLFGCSKFNDLSMAKELLKVKTAEIEKLTKEAEVQRNKATHRMDVNNNAVREITRASKKVRKQMEELKGVNLGAGDVAYINEITDQTRRIK
jgi:predicted DNA-binding protein (UPF0251 family)